MITKFSIRNFKVYDSIEIKPLERFNLISGKNNVGKTSLLEAIFLHEGAHNAGLALMVEKFRGITTFDNADFLNELFTKFKTQEDILLEADYSDGNYLLLRIRQEAINKSTAVDIGNVELQGTASLTPKIVFRGEASGGKVCDSQFFVGTDPKGVPRPMSSPIKQALRPSAIFVSNGISKEEKNRINAVRFSKQVIKKEKDKIIEALKIIDSRLVNLELSMRGNENFVCGDIGYAKMLPLSLMGEGMDRYLSLVLSILTAENGIVLIDEIENGFYHSICPNIWKNLAKLAREHNVQIVATTHSYECIKSAHESFRQDETYDFVLHRLDRVEERIEDVSYDRDTLEAALKSDMEIR